MRYCRNCRWYEELWDNGVLEDRYCIKEVSWYTEIIKWYDDKPIVKTKYLSCSIDNADNDCIYYQRKWWKFWIT